MTPEERANQLVRLLFDGAEDSSTDQIKAIAELVIRTAIAEEREACAKIAYDNKCQYTAIAIRARGEQHG